MTKWVRVYRYFDVLDVAGLKSKAVALNNSFFLQKMQQLPIDYSIDYVHTQGDLIRGSSSLVTVSKQM